MTKRLTLAATLCAVAVTPGLAHAGSEYRVETAKTVTFKASCPAGCTGTAVVTPASGASAAAVKHPVLRFPRGRGRPEDRPADAAGLCAPQARAARRATLVVTMRPPTGAPRRTTLTVTLPRR